MSNIKNIIITGAAGYIGSHTLVELVNNPAYNIIPLDNYSNSSRGSYRAVEMITGKKINEHKIDLTNYTEMEKMLEQHWNIDGIIHFAAYKSITESINKPLEYYENNMGGLTNLLHFVKKFKIQHFIFSSSCIVYGNTDKSSVDENTPSGETTSPYANTKQAGEKLLADFAQANNWFNYYALRYFNPAGCHPSGWLGETSNNAPQSLVPAICAAATGQKPLTVFGDDYPTPDGTCIRDYVHVCDIANAHMLALNKMLSPGEKKENEIFNLGSGKGYSVKEVIEVFECANLIPVPYTIGSKRAGDLVSIYASIQKAKEKLGWTTNYSLKDIVKTAWNFYQTKMNMPEKKYLPSLFREQYVSVIPRDVNSTVNNFI